MAVRGTCCPLSAACLLPTCPPQLENVRQPACHGPSQMEAAQAAQEAQAAMRREPLPGNQLLDYLKCLSPVRRNAG